MIFLHPIFSYSNVGDAHGLIADWRIHAAADPFNPIATAIFLVAIVHTFLAPTFERWGQRVAQSHPRGGKILHILGEVELIFALWAIVLLAAMAAVKGVAAPMGYLHHGVDFSGPLFVVVIMAVTATRGILQLAEWGLKTVARRGRETVGAWWLSILIVAPLLGSVVTEPAAMTIGALLLAKTFYRLQPSPRLAYGTLGLLFVNVSVGGTLTNFAAPPVLLVSHIWGWSTIYLFTHFGWKAALGIVLSTSFYYWFFRVDFARLQAKQEKALEPVTAFSEGEPRAPLAIVFVQIGFVVWTIWAAHRPVFFLSGFVVFLGFYWATSRYQSRLALRAPLLVGLFLAGLVIHGGLQAWWIQPLLSGLGRGALFLGATVLTAFNDNAAITYLATLVPNFTDSLKYAVVAGAVTGGGLTVIANAPNPVGQTLLQQFFPKGISPVKLMLGAIGPTCVVALCFWL